MIPSASSAAARCNVVELRIGKEHACRGREFREPSCGRLDLTLLEHERPSGGAQRVEDGDEHRPEAVGAVGREELPPVGLVLPAERAAAPR